MNDAFTTVLSMELNLSLCGLAGDWTILDHDVVGGIPSRRWAEPWKQKEREKGAVREKETEENEEGRRTRSEKKGERGNEREKTKGRHGER